MKKLLFSLLFLCFATPVLLAQKAASREEWVRIFKTERTSAAGTSKIAGQPLNDNYKNTVRVEDGMMRIVYDDYKTFDGKYGHIYYKKPYSYYRVRFTYRFLGKQTPGGAFLERAQQWRNGPFRSRRRVCLWIKRFRFRWNCSYWGA